MESVALRPGGPGACELAQCGFGWMLVFGVGRWPFPRGDWIVIEISGC